jgi:hypothetical protein
MSRITVLLSILSVSLAVFIRDKWVKITLLSLTLLYLPVNSGGYCLGYFLTSIILFFATTKSRPLFLNIIILVIYILVLNPIQYVFVPFETFQLDIFGKSIGIWNLLVANTGLTFLWIILLFMSLKEGIKNITGMFYAK